jgi:fatty-acyl-CoA synthase
VNISYVKGVLQPPLLSKTLGDFFDDQVERFGDQELLIVKHQQIRWSWQELQRKVDEFSMGLMNLGFKKGDRLGIMLPTLAEWVG